MLDASRSLKERVREWHLLRQRKPRVQPQDRQAGRDAELKFEEIARSSFSQKDAVWFSGRRVPRSSESGRYEIDQIIITHKHLYLVEVKNWSGRLNFRGSDFRTADWFQEKRDKSLVSHGTIWSKSIQKEAALRAYLKNNGLDIPASRFSTIFLFMNPHLSVPKDFHDHPMVVMRHQLDAFLSKSKKSNAAERLISSLISLVTDRETHQMAVDGLFGLMPNGEWALASKLVEPLKQFDRIKFFGGETLSGDVLDVDYGQGPRNLDSLCEQRSALKLGWHSCTLTLALLFFGKKHLGIVRGGSVSRPASAYGKVRFQAAASREQKTFPICEIEEIYRG